MNDRLIAKLAYLIPLILPVITTPLLADVWTARPLAYDLQTAEGPVWDTSGKLYFTEIFAHRVHELNVTTGESKVIRGESGGSNGLAFDSENRLLMCEMLGKRFVRREHDGTIRVLWQSEDGGRGGPNDVVVSAAGNIYFTMPRQKTVYRVTKDDRVAPLITDLAGINGVMLSQDESILYVTEYRNRKVHAFPLNDLTGKVGQGNLFAEITTKGTEHGADGMAVDNVDQLYVTCLGGIWIFDTGGVQTGFISMPNEKVTNCAFAGNDFNTLYITTQKGLFVATRD